MKRVFLLLIAFPLAASAQSTLQPGFDAREYADGLSLFFFHSSIPDSIKRAHSRDPYQPEFNSADAGLLNNWSFYLRTDNVGVINIRGTVPYPASWLENLYTAMIPATGELQLDDSTIFHYRLSADPRAMVHAGWTLALAYLAPGIESTIDRYYHERGVREYLVFGHSQGGAIAFLLRSWLGYEQRSGRIPADVVFKTYCSAAPKPGNLYYAYDYDFLTRSGWGFTVVNAADWVPETPFSVQTLNDFNPTNPLAAIVDLTQKDSAGLPVKEMHGELDRTTRATQREFGKWMGTVVYQRIRTYLPALKEPAYAEGSNYMRAGTPVVLMPDADYRRQFPDGGRNFFIHHLFAAYYFLLKKDYPASYR